MLNQLLVCLCSTGEKISMKIIMGFLHQLLAVLTEQKKQALPALIDSCLHVAQHNYASLRDRGSSAPNEKKSEA